MHNTLCRVGRLLRLFECCSRTAALLPGICKQQQSKENGGSFLQQRKFHLGTAVHKYNKTFDRNDENDSDDDPDGEFKDERDSKVLKTRVNSLRADLLLRFGLGIARNKIETIFYDSKVRVNGQKVFKKSEQVGVGDEIDVIRGYSQANSSHIIVSRVIVLGASARQDGDGLSVSLRRYKSLLIENYSGANAYKSSEVAAH